MDPKDLLRQKDESKEDALKRIKEKYDGRFVQFSGVVIESTPDVSSGLYKNVVVTNIPGVKREKLVGAIVYLTRAGGTQPRAVGSIITVEGDAEVGDDLVIRDCKLLSTIRGNSRRR